MIKLSLEKISFAYGASSVLQNISLTFEPGLTYMLGPNGVGKTTLLQLLLGHLMPSEGKITLDGKELGTFSSRERAKKLCYVPQQSGYAFDLSVLEMVTLGGFHNLGFFNEPDERLRERAKEQLDLLSIGQLANRLMSTLSGGQKQLVLIARALLQGGEIMLLDEVTANLDFGFAQDVLRLLLDLSKERLVIVTGHDPTACWSYANQVLMLQEGGVAYHGTPHCKQAERALSGLYKRPLEVIRLAGYPPFVCTTTREENRT